MVTAAIKLKMLAPWKESYDYARQHTKKQKHCFANKGPSSQGRLWFFQWPSMDVRVGLLRKLSNSWETVETMADFIFLGSKITADGDYSHKIKNTYSLEGK